MYHLHYINSNLLLPDDCQRQKAESS